MSNDFTARQVFEFNAAQIADGIEKDLGIKVSIDKGIDGFTRIYPSDRAQQTARLTVSAIGLNRAASAFTAAFSRA
jgi:hypothetical protein